MAFFASCTSDPILKFIRSTYDAIPLKIPDPKFAISSLIASKGHSIRYAGNLAEDFKNEWEVPQTQKIQLPDVATTFSSQMRLSYALELLGPFIASLFGNPLFSLNGTVNAHHNNRLKVSFSISRATRNFVSPAAYAKSLSKAQLKLPAIGILPGANLLVVDAILCAREINIDVSGDGASEVAGKVADMLIGSFSSEAVLKNGSNLTVTGTTQTPFAITCLKLDVLEDGSIVGISIPKSSYSLQAIPVENINNINHFILGDSKDLLFYD